MSKKVKIHLKPLCKKHLPIIRDWRNTDGIWEFNTQFTLLNMENQKNWYNEVTKKNTIRKMYVIFYGEIPIGICGLINLDKNNKQADVAIIIGNKKYHGKNLGSESLKKLIEIGFKKFHLHKIGADIFEFNTVSFRLFKKLGFSCDAIKIDSIWRFNRWWEIHTYSILKSEFEN